MRIIYASRVMENTIMDIANFEALSHEEKNNVLVKLSRPKIEKKDKYTLFELEEMNDIERFEILSDEEKQKVLNGERKLRIGDVTVEITERHVTEYRLFLENKTEIKTQIYNCIENLDAVFQLNNKHRMLILPKYYKKYYSLWSKLKSTPTNSF